MVVQLRMQEKQLGKVVMKALTARLKKISWVLILFIFKQNVGNLGNVVGRPELQKFVGALAGQGAKKGIFITTSNFTKEALDYTPKNETKIVLIDGEQLAQLMIDYNLGCTTQQIYELKKIDTDYFDEE